MPPSNIYLSIFSVSHFVFNPLKLFAFKHADQNVTVWMNTCGQYM